MINRAELKNFGQIEQLDWKNLSKINLIIGNNGCGKTFLLKSLYSAMRTLEEYRRGDDNRHKKASDILVDKLYGTFQPDKIGDLVRRQADSALSFKLTFDNKTFDYSFGKDTRNSITYLENYVEPRSNNSIFLPAKEVLSIYNVILNSRENDRLLGFDDTYLDLARALRIPTTQGNNKVFAASRKKLEAILNGKIELDDTSGRWFFKKEKQKFPIGVTAEGVKKISILDILLGNSYIDANSIIFIDEIEANLHPHAISNFLEIIEILASRGIQFFIASHSYFVVKKLFLIAQEKQLSIPVLSYQDNEWVQSDLKDKLSDNPIIDESIRLYEEQLDLSGI